MSVKSGKKDNLSFYGSCLYLPVLILSWCKLHLTLAKQHLNFETLEGFTYKGHKANFAHRVG